MNTLSVILAMFIGGAAAADEIALPCQQHFADSLAPATYWQDSAQLEGLPDWHKDKKIAALVGKLAPRDVPQDDAVSQLTTFRKAPHGKKAVPMVFTGLVEETDRQRSEVIAKIRDMAERQANLTGTIRTVDDELSKTPDSEGAKHDEIVQRRGYLQRDYDSLDKTLRYACQIPVDLEERLGAFSKALQE
jgi:hypothetical protein